MLLKKIDKYKNKGFTLVELIIIVVFIGIFTAIALTRTQSGLNIIQEQIAIDQITNEARRQAKPITPVELGSDEIYAILRKRLLESEPDASVVESVADEYAKILSDAVTSKTLERSAEKIASEVQATYPFHPSLKTVVATFKDNENFRQTRGLMTIAALMIKSAQARKHNDAYLLGPQHMNLADRETRDFVNNIYNLDAAITQDIVDTGATDAHAEKIDDEAGNDAASQAARLILMASLAEASDAVKGLQENEVLADRFTV